MAIKEALKPFDKSTSKKFDEHDISSALRDLIPEDKNKVSEELKAEGMAFNFVEDYQDTNTGWGTYFGPMLVLKNGDGTDTESPSIKQITPQMIDYWEKRANESTNPIIIARYSGLVWDFMHIVTGEKPSHGVCRLYIKALIDQANGDFYKYEVNTFRKIGRALKLSISLNDDDLIKNCKEATINFERKHAQDNKPGLWGYAFDLLVGNRRVNLREEEEKEIIKELEQKLSRLTKNDTEGQKIDPWAAEKAAERLAIYYRKKQQNAEVKRVILDVGKAYDKIVGEVSAMQASGWLENLYELYIRFNLKQEAESVLVRIRKLGPKVAGGLIKITTPFKIEQQKADDYIAFMTKGDMKNIIDKIAVKYIPNKEDVKKQILKLAKEAPLQFIITRKIQDEKGRVIATIGSLENDLEGRVVIQVSQNLSISSFFLRAVINDAIIKKGLNKSDILAFIKDAPIINKERIEIIEKGLDAYFQNNFLVFIHLIIPQIEEAIRNIVEYAGGNVLRPSKVGGFDLRTFGDILGDNIIREVLGEDFADYFRILFIDQRGWNLRNRVCHGIATPDMFNFQTADRILHSLICLGLIREKK